MNHKERVLRAFEFKEGDRVPLDIGGINVTSMHIKVEPRLKAAIGIPAGETVIGSVTMQSALVDESILQHFDADFRCLYAADGNKWAPSCDGCIRDEYGIDYKLSPDGLYYDFARHPLANADLADIERHKFADPQAQLRVHGFSERIDRFGREYALVLEGFRDSIFGICSWLRGIEQFYMDLMDESSIADALLEKVTEHQIAVVKFILGRFGKHIDIVRIGDDLGSQNALLISPAIYRAKIKPRHARLVAAIKHAADCKVVIHSCGAIREILPDFVEIGIDGINPVQTSCTAMVPSELKKEFGRKLTFWGGGIDTQQVLCKVSAQEVREFVKENMKKFKSGGGYVFAQIHNIQPDVPTENILAMYDAFRESCAY